MAYGYVSVAGDGNSSTESFRSSAVSHNATLPMSEMRNGGGDIGPTLAKGVNMWKNQTFEEYANTKALNVHALMEGDKETGGDMACLREYLDRPLSTKFNLGSAVHEAVLEPELFKRQYIVKVLKKNDPDQYEHQKELIKNGAKGITEDAMKSVRGCVNAIHEHKEARQLLLGGETEVSGYATHPDFKFPMKIRVDSLHRDKKIIVDLKSEGRKIGPHLRQKISNDLKWHWQADYYTRVTELIEDGKFEFLHVFVETDPPHRVKIAKMSQASLDLAAEKYYPLLQEYAWCLENNEWPTDDKRIEIFSPGYAFGDGLQ